MNSIASRRQILKSAAVTAGVMVAGPLARGMTQPDSAKPTPGAGETPLFKISLAQWSLHRALQSKALDPMDFPAVSAREYGVFAVEYVNSFYRDKLADSKAVATLAPALKKRCDDAGVASVLIMCDGEGDLGDPDEAKRLRAVDRHKKWAELARALGCHSIRVNAASKGEREEQAKLAADGLRRLTEFCAGLGLCCIVENHGGLSSHGDWLADVMKRVGHPSVGTLPDFGNFYEYDRYKGVEEMMPFAKGVSAKSHEFDDKGNETRTDYARMLRVVLKAGYRGHIGIEFEGDKAPEPEGIRATKRLLERLRAELAPEFAAKTGKP
ncbi:MAG: sugar phosphate isomerase/epimerase [Leptolyngbya sp. PLA1]|nr:sugar phosphate isomerase/epimerase [Leptolyngbya sp. PLA1]